jgi:hypothetical protein
MAVVKSSGITRRIAEEYDRRRSMLRPGPATGLFCVRDLLDCPRWVVLRSRDNDCAALPHAVSDWNWRHLFRVMPGFQVLRENLSLADGASRLSGFAELLASYNGEMLLIKLIERRELPEGPLKADVTDMVVCMYLAAVWHGLLVYHCGDSHSIHFLNPDRSDSKKILSWAAARAEKLSDHILHETTPSGETRELCSACAFRESCDKYQGLAGATEQSERAET